MFYLKGNFKRGFKFKQPYPNKEPFISQGLVGKPHLGDDWLTPIGTPLYAPFNGMFQYVKGSQGGHQAHFRREGKKELIRFLHLNVPPRTGYLKMGEQFGVTGNSGSATNAPHVHSDISKNGILNINNINNFLDPTEYFKEVDMYVIKENIITYKINQPEFTFEAIEYAKNWLKQVTNGELIVETETFESQVKFSSKIATDGNHDQSPMVNWNEIWGEAKDGFRYASLFFDPTDVGPHAVKANFATKIEINGIKKFLMQTVCPPLTPGAEVVVKAEIIIHEWLHNWYQVLNDQGLNLVDDVHSHGGLNTPSNGFSEVVLKLKPHWHLIADGVQEKQMNQTKVVLSKDGKTVWKCTPVPDIGMEAFRKIANVEGFEVPNPLPPSKDL